MKALVDHTFTVNGRSYQPPARPVVVVLLDGSSEDYLVQASVRGLTPTLDRLSASGFRGLARGALPSFTNVNNCAIVTGLPPAGTGIAGNYFLDPATGQEVMTHSPRFLKPETILAAAANAGRRVAMVTAKDKLRGLLSKNLRGIAFSAEKAGDTTLLEHGIGDVEALAGPPPPIYSGEASLYVLRAGAALIETGRADFCYLTTTDFVQHKHAPAAPEALSFYAGIDDLLARLLKTGAVLGLTADHGMNAKTGPDGRPQVAYLETELTERFGVGIRVVCAITDPYVAHHGALGSAVSVYVTNESVKPAVETWLAAREGVDEVIPRELAARRLQLPADSIGDFFVLSERDWVLGRTPAHHDLSQLEGPLRSHGGRYEEMVPFILSAPLLPEYARRAAGDLRNFDIFDFISNGLQP